MVVASKQSLNYIRDGQSKVRTRDGIIGTVTAVLMYVFYINTIRNYLNAAPGTEKDWLQPAMACVNCCIWVAYGLFKERRDWPVAIANAPGIIFGGVTAIIALM